MTIGKFIEQCVTELSGLYTNKESTILSQRLLREYLHLPQYTALIEKELHLEEAFLQYNKNTISEKPHRENDELALRSNDAVCKMYDALSRLKMGEPIQYILGYEEFCGHKFRVSSQVLIPRPETEELVLRIANDITQGVSQELKILDICTGSGCIAYSLAFAFPLAEIFGCDISKEALNIARNQSEYLLSDHEVYGQKRTPYFFECDIFSPTATQDCLDALNIRSECVSEHKFDIIVSNPPYICEAEKALMHKNVLNYEPALALFVPDSDPLKFYEKISDIALELLAPNGKLYFEINEKYGKEIKSLLGSKFSNCTIINDINCKQRIALSINK